MIADPSSSEAIVRINRELRRAAGPGRDLLFTDARIPFAASSLCTVYRRMRSDLDQFMAWLREHACELVPLFLLLVEIADGACRARSAER